MDGQIQNPSPCFWARTALQLCHLEIFIAGEEAKCRFFVKNCIKIGFCHR